MPLLSPILLAATTAGASISTIQRYRRKRKRQKSAEKSEISTESRYEIWTPRDEEDDVNHYLAVNTLSLTWTVSGLFYPPLIIAGIPLNIYTTLPAIQKAIHLWHKEKRVGSASLEAILVMGTMGIGWQISSTSISWGYSFVRKIKLQLKNDIPSFIQRVTQPPKVWAELDGVEMQVPLDAIESGDVLVMQKNNILPLPGRVVKGVATLNTYLATQRSEPIEVETGDMVPPFSLVTTGKIYVQVQM